MSPPGDLDRSIDAALGRLLEPPADLDERTRALTARARLRRVGPGEVDRDATPGPARRAAARLGFSLAAAAAGLAALATLSDELFPGTPVSSPRVGTGAQVAAGPISLSCDELFQRYAPPPSGAAWGAGTFCVEPEKRVLIPLDALGGPWAAHSVGLSLRAGDALGEIASCSLRPEATVVPARVGNEACVLLVEPEESPVSWRTDPGGGLSSYEWAQDGLRFCEVNAAGVSLLRPRIEP